jgi:hypothetical protein
MAFKGFVGKIKNSFKKIGDLTKKIRNDRKKLFDLLTDLQKNLEKQNYIVLYYNNQYRRFLDYNSINAISKVSEIANVMSQLVYKERARIKNESELLDKTFNIYEKEIRKVLKNNRKSTIKEFGNIELGIKKELNAELQEEAIIRNIISLHDEKEKLVKNLMKRIKSNDIKKNWKKLNKLIKEERRMIKALYKYMKKIEKALREEINPINQAERLIRY